MSDNKTLLFNQTVDGWLNWFTVAADGSAPVKAITNEVRNNRSGVLNKNRTKLVYLSGRDEVRILDLKTWENKTIVKDEIWAFQNSDPGFSPNDEYVLFTAVGNFEQDVFVYNIKENKTMNITKVEMIEALIQARVALQKDIRQTLRDRHGIIAKFARANAREKIAAYRVLSNLDKIDATTYTHSKRDLARVKKALAK